MKSFQLRQEKYVLLEGSSTTRGHCEDLKKLLQETSLDHTLSVKGLWINPLVLPAPTLLFTIPNTKQDVILYWVDHIRFFTPLV